MNSLLENKKVNTLQQVKDKLVKGNVIEKDRIFMEELEIANELERIEGREL